jgi:hypothetical protein
MGCFSQSVLEQFLPGEHGPVILAEDLHISRTQRCKGKGDLTQKLSGYPFSSVRHNKKKRKEKKSGVSTQTAW